MTTSERFRRRGTVCDVSVAGAYVALRGSLPPLGSSVLLTFALPGDLDAITCEARVQWHNAPSTVSMGAGAAKPALPAGCGLAFVRVESKDAGRIAGRVSSWRELAWSDVSARPASPERPPVGDAERPR